MRIFLQHSKSALFFQGAGTWTRDMNVAFDFEHSQRAIEYAHSQRLAGTQIVVVFIDEDSIETVPVPIEVLPPPGGALMLPERMVQPLMG